MPYPILVRLADIDEDERVVAIDLCFDLDGIDLAFGQAWGGSGRLLRDTAELVIVDQLGDGPVIAADGALGILAQLELAELHTKGIVQQESPDERLADA